MSWYNRGSDCLVALPSLLVLGVLEDSLDTSKGLDKQEMVRRDATVTNPYPWSGPKDQQNKTAIFLSVYGAFYVIVRSKKICLSELDIDT